MSSSNDAYHKLDDTDPSISYTGEWFDNPGIAGAFNKTLSSTVHAGDTAHIEFVASQIVVIGATVAPANAGNFGPISGYTLDGSNGVFLFQADPRNATGVVFYNSGPLTMGKHTLDISVVKIQNDIPYLLDAIFLQENPASQTASASATAIWISTVFVTPSSFATAAGDEPEGTFSGLGSDSSSSSSTPVGAIVGGVVGGVALLIAAALAFYLLFYRPRHRGGSYNYRTVRDAAPLFAAEKDDVDGNHSVAQAAKVEPFIASAPPYTPSSQFGARSPPATPHAYPPVPSSASGSRAGSSTGRTLSVVNDTSGGASLTPAQRKATEAQRSQSEAEAAAVQYHADSGVRFDEHGRPIEASASTSTREPLPLADVPPEYTPS